MSVAMILLPLFVHVLIVLVGLFAPLVGRVHRVEPERGTAPQDRALSSLLFATLTMLALATHKADIVFLLLAIVFVLADAVAALPGFAAGPARDARLPRLVALIALAVAWGMFALAILLNI